MRRTKSIATGVLLTLFSTAVFPTALIAQNKTSAEPAATQTPTPAATTSPQEPTKGRPRTTNSKKNDEPSPAPADKQEKPATSSDIPQEVQSNRHGQTAEEEAVVSYYNNFFTSSQFLCSGRIVIHGQASPSRRAVEFRWHSFPVVFS